MAIWLDLAASEKPTMVSAVMSLTKGNWLSRPTVAARAVLPVPAGPSSRQVSKGFLSLVLTCSKSKPQLDGLIECQSKVRMDVANVRHTMLLCATACENTDPI